MDGFKPLAHSSRPLTNSSRTLISASQKSAEKTAFATERGRLLLGQFRRGEANDPGTFIASVAAVLARYSERTIVTVTDPRSGLASKGDWLPTVREVVEACESLEGAERRGEERRKTDEKTIRERAEFEAKPRPTIEELQERTGPNWGLRPVEPAASEAERRRVEVAIRQSEREREKIIAEYERCGVEPMYAGEMLISPSLLEKIDPGKITRHRDTGTDGPGPEAA